MADLVPIRVKIRVQSGKSGLVHKFPDFNKINSTIRKGMDWSIYFDVHGIGWHYDKKSGIGEVDTYNDDPNTWYGSTCVPKDFADAAFALFPQDVEIIDETKFETFYNDRAHAHEHSEVYDQKILDGINAKKAAGGTLTAADNKALDPNDSSAGVRKNLNKLWKDFKGKKGLSIDPTLRKP